MNEQRSLADTILGDIRAQRIRMRPKMYFIAGSLLLGTSVGLALAAGLMSASIVSYRLHHHSPFGFLFFGPVGFAPFIAAFPWTPIVIAFLGIGAGAWLLRHHYALGYRHTAFGIGVGVCSLVIALGVAFDLLGLHQTMRGVTPMRALYSGHFRGAYWLAGTVTQARNGEIILAEPDASATRVLFSPTTNIQPQRKIERGEWVRILGQDMDGDFDAAMIRHGPGDADDVRLLVNDPE